MAWVAFLEAIFSCLNLNPDDGFSPYNMAEVFNKTGHGVRPLQEPEMNLSQFCSQSFFGNSGAYM